MDLKIFDEYARAHPDEKSLKGFRKFQLKALRHREEVRLKRCRKMRAALVRTAKQCGVKIRRMPEMREMPKWMRRVIGLKG